VASIAEKELMEKHYKPDLFLTVTYKNVTCEDKATQDFRNYLNQISRKRDRWSREGLGTHLWWFGRYDVQRLRQKEKYETVIHFHVFIEIEGGIPAVRLDAVKALFKRNWIFGDKDIKKYNSEQYGITYARMGHKGDITGNSCPRIQHRCNKKDRVCQYDKEPSLLTNRYASI